MDLALNVSLTGLCLETGAAVGHILSHLGFDVQIGRPHRCVIDLWVEPEYRRQGVAKSLFGAVAKQGWREGCRYLYWFMDPKNKEADGFYRGIGAGN